MGNSNETKTKCEQAYRDLYKAEPLGKEYNGFRLGWLLSEIDFDGSELVSNCWNGWRAGKGLPTSPNTLWVPTYHQAFFERYNALPVGKAFETYKQGWKGDQLTGVDEGSVTYHVFQAGQQDRATIDKNQWPSEVWAGQTQKLEIPTAALPKELDDFDKTVTAVFLCSKAVSLVGFEGARKVMELVIRHGLTGQ